MYPGGRPIQVWILYVVLAWIVAQVATGAVAIIYLTLRLLLAPQGISI